MSLVSADLGSFPILAGAMSIGSVASFTLDQAGDYIALIFRIPQTGTIDKVHYRLGAGFTGTFRAEMRTVDVATGLPNAAGTLYGSSTSISVVNPTSGNKTAAIAATATAGDTVAVVYDAQAFTSGACTINWRSSFLGEPLSSSLSNIYPYTARSTNGGATQGKQDRPMMSVMLEYSGAVFVPIAGYYNWIGDATSYSITTSGTTRRGNIFRPRTPRRAFGMYAHLGFGGSGAVNLVAYDSGGTQLAICTIDKDIVYSGGGVQGYGFWPFDSGTTLNLSAGTDYYCMAVGADATGATLYGWNNGVAGGCAIMPGGANCYGASYAGSFATDNTTRNEIGFLTDQEDNGAGGGGMLYIPNLSGT